MSDWGYPNQDDRWLTIDKYINGYINNCVDIIRDLPPTSADWLKAGD
ncbi:hypothetical protein [Nostoc sp. JL33]|nr:hypothetical protein [Nostoc sp. JL33]MBN3873955.1 hypothetical protein [Nostoc sp. JL33]